MSAIKHYAAQIIDNAIMRQMTQECHVCNGRGMTRNTETVMVPAPANSKSKTKTKYVTTFQGSGCATCHGTGRVER